MNADGYGVVWYAEAPRVTGGNERSASPAAAAGDADRNARSDRSLRPARIAETRPIWRDEEELRATLGLIGSSCVVAALRNGTPGIPMDRSGLLPLTHDRWTFVLNGFVPRFRERHMRALRASLPDRLYAELRGSSDSETLFLLVMAALEEGAAPLDALRACARTVAERVGPTEAQLNMLLTDGRKLVAVRTGTVARTNSMYAAAGHPLAPAGVLLSSEPLDEDPTWEPVDGHDAIVVGRDGGVAREPFGL